MACNSAQEFGLLGHQVERDGVLLGKAGRSVHRTAEGHFKVSFVWRETL
jgi:hypothetical protein